MKLNQTQLKRLIKEEMEDLLDVEEEWTPENDPEDFAPLALDVLESVEEDGELAEHAKDIVDYWITNYGAEHEDKREGLESAVLYYIKG
mgnify:FL=1